MGQRFRFLHNRLIRAEGFLSVRWATFEVRQRPVESGDAGSFVFFFHISDPRPCGLTMAARRHTHTDTGTDFYQAELASQNCRNWSPSISLNLI